MSREQFFSEYFEQRPFIHRGALAAGAIDWSEIDRALYVGETSNANIRVHKDGFVDESRYTETCVELGVIRHRIIKPLLSAMLEEGASIIYNRIEGVSPPIRALCNQVARFAGAPAVANGYISFGDKETFGNHWDTHDVFALQLIGRKRWLVYEPTFPLPLSGQTSLHHKHECPPQPVIDEILHAGDVLYIPRGWWHTAIPLQEETFHVAIGTHPHTVADYVTWAVKHLLPQQLSCRRAVRHDSTGQQTIAQAREELCAALFSEDSFAQYVRHQVDVERVASPFNVAREFRASLCADIEAGHYTINSRFGADAARTARTLNGTHVGASPHGPALIRTLAAAAQPLSFDALRAAHGDIGRSELRLALDDLMRRDIAACVSLALGEQ
ncbi:cupin domain-containing protein [[Empedobacter] haloabium]|uniref:Cupin domain-containing protein n=1 Tax=[Empedobacter] haloabium TaxID=592317 RepID=A0ABZ1UFF5_9BURK